MRVAYVTKPSPVISHLNNVCVRMICWPEGTLRCLNSALCLVYKTTAGRTGGHGCSVQLENNTPACFQKQCNEICFFNKKQMLHKYIS